MINNAIDVIKVLLETKKEKPMALKKFDLLKQTKKKVSKNKKNEWMNAPSVKKWNIGYLCAHQVLVLRKKNFKKKQLKINQGKKFKILINKCIT